jgi:photosystem II stability/assembly factor-like uncharacterized protein
MKKTLTLLFSLAITGMSFAQSRNWIIQRDTIGAGAVAGSIAESATVVNDNVVWVALNKGGFAKTIDGGNAWTFGKVSTNVAKIVYQIGARTGAKAVAITFDGSASEVFKTADGGATWAKDTNIFKVATSFPDVVHAYNDSVFVAVGDPDATGFEIFRTTNGATSWTRLPAASSPAPASGEYPILPVSAKAGDTLWVGTNKGRMLRSIDKGLTWTSQPVTSAAWSVTQIAASSNNSLMIRVDSLNAGGTAYAGTQLWKSSNGGTTFVRQTVFPAIRGLYGVHGAGAAGHYFITGTSPSGTRYAEYYTNNDGVSFQMNDTSVARGATTYFPVIEFSKLNRGWDFNRGGATTRPYLFASIWSGNTLVGVDRLPSFASEVKLYPNPTQGLVTVELPEQTAFDYVRVFNTMGTLVFEKRQFVGTTTLDLGQQASGVYLLQIKNAEGVISKKLILDK